MAVVTLVHDVGGDWIAMYIDGKIVDEGHNLDERSVVSALVGRTVDSVQDFESSFEDGAGRGCDTLDEYTDLVSW